MKFPSYLCNANNIFMKRNETKRNYDAPRSVPTDVAIEKALLVSTARLRLQVDETQNVNAEVTGADQPGGEMYFEY